ncbi:MAG: RNA 3'-terminal phosphate cyclase [Pirellulales bacterium]|nr:RNA 3'-terminal phosphate cyclase [Pirellulales bacterium]
MITIDGSFGEGGGQILRTSLALSLLTGKPFAIDRIRAKRKKPGLLNQHLTAVHAAAQVGEATVHGDSLHSTSLVFEPAGVRPGQYRFDVGTAGSTTLVLQTVLPALVLASGPSQLRLIGGTHNMNAPPFDFLQKAFLPLLERMGPKVEATLDRWGFYPAGGGQVSVNIEPVPALKPIELLDRGKIVRQSACAVVSRLPRHIAEREVDTVRRKLSWPKDWVTTDEVDSSGPGNVVTVEVGSRHVTEWFTGFGRIGVPAEKVAGEVVREVKRYIEAGVPVGEHLADQLILPLALAGAGSFRTLPPSAHTTTNIETVKRFLDAEFEIEQIEREVHEIRVRPSATKN